MSFDHPNPVLSALGRALEGALNRALALDAETAQALTALDGRTVGLTLAPTLAMQIRVEGPALRVGPLPPTASDLGVSASPFALLAMAAPWNREAGLPVGKVNISGDAGLARRLQALAQRFSPDWEEPIARVFGDVLGHRIALALRSAFNWTRESAQAMALNAGEYLRDESRLAVSGAELESWLDGVDQVSSAVERLERRVARLSTPAGKAT